MGGNSMTSEAGKSAAEDLSCIKLQAGYGEFLAVHDASLRVAAGEVVGLCGPNGAGKTTLLKCLIGTVAARSGQIWIGGREVTRQPARKRTAAGCAIVPEGRRLFLGMTVTDNLLLGAGAVRRRNYRSRLATVYDMFPRLRELGGRLAGVLSGGEQQMCAIGRAMMAAPQTILIDELSLGLAPSVADAVAERLRDLSESGVSVLVVDQDVVRLKEIGDRLYFLRGGRASGGGEAGEADVEAMSMWMGDGTQEGVAPLN